MSKNGAVILAMAVFLLFSGCGGNKSKSVSSNAAVLTTSSPGMIKAMTYNIRVDTMIDGFNRWGSRKKAACQIVADNSPDILGIQEALHRQVETFKTSFPEYNSYAVGRDDGKEDGEACAIFYRKDRFVMNDSGTFWFSDNPTKPGSKGWGDPWPRLCSWVHLTEKDTGMGLYVYNVHLAALSQRAREKSAQMLAKRVSERKIGDPFIVLGDFNMKLSDSGMVYLQNADGKTPYPKMVDAWQSVHGDKGGATTKSGRSKIDHIVSDGAIVLDAKVDRRRINGKRASDHFPVVADLLFTGGTVARTVDAVGNTN